MMAHLRANLVLLGLTLVICAVLYPLALLAVGQGLFPGNANGGLRKGPDGEIVGASLIAQEFKGPQWFHPRPSAADYKGDASSGSNLGANNPKLRERVEEALKARGDKGQVPADAVTASGSGLDPHITLRNAQGQTARVVAAWEAKGKTDVRAAVEGVLKQAAFEPLAGLAGGEALVNVLEVNLELAEHFRKR